MPAKDFFHDAVKQGLIVDGWTITADPLIVALGGVDMYVDLGAEKLIAAEKENRRIAVEVKSFLGPSPISDFHAALGQFVNYRLAMETQEPQRTLYVAIPADVYATFFMLPFTQTAIRRNAMPLIVFDPQREVLTQWIE